MAAELFDKIYGRYYYVVRRMLEAGVRAPLTRRDMDAVCGAYSYRAHHRSQAHRWRLGAV